MTPGELLVFVVALAFGIGGAAWLTRRFDLRRPNFRNQCIPSMAGLVLVLAGSFFYAVEWLSQGVRIASAAAYFMVTLTFGVLGALDDVVGDRTVSGFRGHLGALARGRVTTGFAKLAGGAVVSLVAGFILYQPYIAKGLLAAAIIALSANAMNLIDTRPGRSLFAFLAGSIALIVILHAMHAMSIGFLLYFAMAVAVIMYPLDASARVMLGDTGSNVFGAILGLAATLILSTGWQIGLVTALAVFNLLCERYSLSKTIESNSVLRGLDRKIGVR